MFQERNQRKIYDLKTQDISSLDCENVMSRPSLEIGFLTAKEEEWIALPCQSIKDFTTPEGGLARHISKDIFKTLPSENVKLKVPDTYFLHHFVYNCKTSTFTSNIDSRRFKSTLKKSNDKEFRNTMSCECAGDLLSNMENINSKSQTEIILKIPKLCQEDSLLDIKLMGTALALHPSISSEVEELNYIDLSPELERKQDNFRKCNVPLGLEKVDSSQKNTENFRIVVSTEEDTESCYICSSKKESVVKENGTSPNNDTNQISIKLADHLFLNLVTDTDDQPENISSQGCDIQADRKLSGIFPGIKILVKCNGETIREISSPRLRDRYRSNDEEKEKNYNQTFCVNICNEQCINIETDECTDTTCDKKSKRDDIPPIEFCPTCMTVNTALGSMPSLKPKCNLIQEVKPPDNCCTKCPLESNACSFAKPAQPAQKRGSQQTKKNNQKQSTNKKSDNKKGKSEAKPKKAAQKQQSSSSLRNSVSKRGSGAPEAKSSLCACPSDKNDIASLGSFSLFFIINDMKTGDCSCPQPGKSGSNELLKTAMICVHVDNSMGNKGNQMNKTSSCPAVVSSFNTQGNMTDKTGGSICSCPSRSSKTSSCSCPSVRTPPAPSTCACPSVQSPKGYVCPYKSKEMTAQKGPVTQSTNTSLRSSLHKNPCCQPSQLRFSVSIQAERSTANPCQSCSAHQPRQGQTSVQVCPSNRSACVQPSSTGHGPQPQGVQATISQKSACVQPSTPTCSQARQVLSNICPPSCKINFPTVSSFVVGKLPCTPRKKPSTCDMKAGPSFTSWVAKSVSCPSLKQKKSSVCVNNLPATQSKSCSLCISVSKLNDSRDTSLKRVCSFTGECKQSTSKIKLTPSCTSVKSKTSCSICKELSKLGSCEEGPTSKPFKGRPRAIPASAQLKRTKNFNKLSHLDVSGADNFIYGENRKKDLTLITADYGDLKKAFEQFMVADNAKNPKCKYIKKC